MSDGNLRKPVAIFSLTLEICFDLKATMCRYDFWWAVWLSFPTRRQGTTSSHWALGAEGCQRWGDNRTSRDAKEQEQSDFQVQNLEKTIGLFRESHFLGLKLKKTTLLWHMNILYPGTYPGGVFFILFETRNSNSPPFPGPQGIQCHLTGAISVNRSVDQAKVMLNLFIIPCNLKCSLSVVCLCLFSLFFP